jgi:tRNA G18 (ribose-2'-O)-methylase SpoU
VVELITDLKKQNITIVSLEIADKSIPYTDLKMSFPICFVLGREYDGVNPEVLKLSDHTIHLPIFGMANSINVSTTAAVMLYEAIKQIQN